MDGLSVGIVSRLNVAYPENLKEQEKIIAVLSDADELIRDLKKRIRKQKDIRQGTMQMLVTGNPDIANVFYRAGYIETWGQGIQKICDECTALGADLPKYEIIGTGLRVYFPALKSALIDQPKTPNRQGVGKDVGLEVGLAEKIIDLILEDSEIKMSEMAEKLEVTTRTIEREMKKLRESGRVIRVGGKRYGHWEVR